MAADRSAFTQCVDCAWDICWQAEACRKKKLADEEAESEQAWAYELAVMKEHDLDA